MAINLVIISGLEEQPLETLANAEIQPVLRVFKYFDFICDKCKLQSLAQKIRLQTHYL